MNTFSNVFNVIYAGSDCPALSLVKSIMQEAVESGHHDDLIEFTIKSVLKKNIQKTDPAFELSALCFARAFFQAKICKAVELGYPIKIYDDGNYLLYTVKTYQDVQAIVNKMFKEKIVAIVVDELEFDTPVFRTCQDWVEELE